MLRNAIFGLGIAVAAIILVPGAANAQDVYTPKTPTAPSLSGSTAIAECAGDVPWINFSVGLIDPDNQSTGHTASLYMTDGTHETTVPLGVLNGNSLSNRVLWRTGFISRDVFTTSVREIIGVQFTQSMIGRILGFGSISISTRGDDQITADLISGAPQASRTIMALKHGANPL